MSQPLEASPAFLREARRRIGAARGRRVPSGRFRRLLLPVSPWQMLGALMLVVLVAGTAVLDPGVRHLACTFLAMLVAGVASGMFHTSHPHHVPLAFWPADEDAVFLSMFRRGVGAAAWPCGVMAVGHVLVAGQVQDWAHPWRALLQGLSLGLCLLLLVVVQAWASLRWTALRRYLAGWVFAGLATLGALLAMRPPMRDGMLEWLGTNGDLISAFSPLGWMVLAGAAWTEGGPWLHAWFLLPLALVLAAVPHAFHELRRLSRFRHRVLFECFGELPEGSPEELGDAVHQARVACQLQHAPGPTANAEAIVDRSFLESPLRAPIRREDRWAWRWWTPAQRLVAECMMRRWPEGGRGPRWVGLAAIPLAWAGTWLASRTGFERGTLLAATIGAHAVAIVMLAPWVSPFQALGLVHFFPVRLWDAAWLRWKHTATRSMVPVLVLPAAGAIDLGLGGQPPWVGAVVGLQIALMPLVVSPFGAVYGLVNGRSSKGGPAFLATLGIAILAFLNIVMVILLFLPFAGLVAQAVVLGLNLLLLRLVARMLHRLRLDPWRRG